jgi:hypothetical protein
MRIRWVQMQTRFAKIHDFVNSGVEATEETLAHLVKLITGEGEKVKAEAKADGTRAKAEAKNVKEKASAEL